MQWFRFYEEEHGRTLDRYWNYDKMKDMAKNLKKKMPKKPIYVLFDATSEEDANCFSKKLMELEAIEIELFPQATYVLGKEKEETVRSLFDRFQGTVVIGDSGGLPAFLFYGRYNWTRLKFIDKNLTTETLVLDIGCGEGYIALCLAKQGKHIVGLDISPIRLKRVKVSTRKTGTDIDLVLGDAQNLPFRDKCFDSAVCAATLDHIPNDKRALQEVARILKTKGSLVLDSQLMVPPISLGIEDGPADKYGHCHKYSYRSLKKLLTEAGFEIKRIEGVGGAVFLLNPNESWPRTFMGRFLWDFLHWLGQYLPFLSSTVVIKASLRV